MDKLSRRDFLKLGAMAVPVMALEACAPKVAKEIAAERGEMVPIEPGPEAKTKISLGKENPVDIPLDWSPDTRTSYIKNPDGGFRLFFSAEKTGYYADGLALYDLSEPRQYVKPSLGKDKYGFNGYRAPSTVFEDAKGTIWSIEHMENWQRQDNGSNFTARISLSKSLDKGQSWQDCGVIIDGRAAQAAGERVTGAGQPSAIIRTEDGVKFVYMYYTDWGVGADSIHLARAPLSQIDNPDAWQKLNDGEPVIYPPENEVYAALASVSFNNQVGKYLTVFETANGFWLTTSRDGLTWGDYQQITQFPEPANRKTTSTNMFSYPSLLSFDTGDEFATAPKGVLIYARGTYSRSPFHAVYREFQISK